MFHCASNMLLKSLFSEKGQRNRSQKGKQETWKDIRQDNSRAGKDGAGYPGNFETIYGLSSENCQVRSNQTN